MRMSLLAGALVLAAGHTTAQAGDYCSRNGVEKFTASECLELFAGTAQPAVKKTPAKSATARAALTMPADATPIAGSNPAQTVEASWKDWAAEHVFLRRSLKDLGSFEAPSALDKAAGAELSWTKDGVLATNTWATQGFLGIGFTNWGDGGDVLQRSVFGAYVEWNRLANSNASLKSKNIDNVIYGLRSELGFGPFFGATQYLNTRGEIVTGFDGNTKNWNLAFEYMPVGLPVPPEWGENTIFSYMGAPQRMGWYVLTVSPKLNAEYRGSLDGSKDPIFAGHNQVFRTGPAINVSLIPYIYARNAPDFTKRTSLQFSYALLYDLISSRKYTLLDTSATYNLDAAENLGLTASYSRGELEATGQKIDLVKVSLSAKFGGPSQTKISP